MYLRVMKRWQWLRSKEYIHVPLPSRICIRDLGLLDAAMWDVGLAFSGRSVKVDSHNWEMALNGLLPLLIPAQNEQVSDTLGTSAMMRFYGLTWEELERTPIRRLRQMSDDMPRLVAQESLEQMANIRPADGRVATLQMRCRSSQPRTEQDDASVLLGLFGKN